MIRFVFVNIFFQKDKFHKNLAKAVDDCILPPLPVERNQGNVTPGATDMGCLWVEKYKPRSFLDLLSPEVLCLNICCDLSVFVCCNLQHNF